MLIRLAVKKCSGPFNVWVVCMGKILGTYDYCSKCPVHFDPMQLKESTVCTAVLAIS